MNNLSQSAPFEKKTEFLQVVMEAEEKRRNSVENKSAVLIASNAILLNAMVRFVLPLTLSGNPILWLQIALTVIAFGAVILSVLISAQVFAPYFTQKQRSRVMDLGPDPEYEHNLFFFSRIAKFKKENYQREIDSLSEQEILEQLTSQVHNLARLLGPQYRGMRLSHGVFIAGAIAFAFLAVTKLFSP